MIYDNKGITGPKGLMLSALMLMVLTVSSYSAISCNAQMYASDTAPYILLNCSGFPAPARSYITSVSYSTNGSDVDNTHTLAWYAGLSGGDGSGNMIKTITLQPGQIFEGYYTVAISGLGIGREPNNYPWVCNRQGSMYARVLVNGSGAFTGLWAGGAFPSSGFGGSITTNIGGREQVTFNGGTDYFSVTTEDCATWYAGNIYPDFNMEGVTSYVTNSTGGFLIKDFYTPSSGKCTGGINCNGVNLQICNTTTNTWQDSVLCSTMCGAPVGGCYSNVSTVCSNTEPAKCEGSNLMVCSAGQWQVQYPCYALCPGVCLGPGYEWDAVADEAGNLNAISVYTGTKHADGSGFLPIVQENKTITGISFRLIDTIFRRDYAPAMNTGQFTVTLTPMANVSCSGAGNSTSKSVSYPVYTAGFNTSCWLVNGSTSGYVNASIGSSIKGINLQGINSSYLINIVENQMEFYAGSVQYVAYNATTDAYYFRGILADRSTHARITSAQFYDITNTSTFIMETYAQNGSQTLFSPISTTCNVTQNEGVVCGPVYYSNAYEGVMWASKVNVSKEGYSSLLDTSSMNYPVNYSKAVTDIICSAGDVTLLSTSITKPINVKCRIYTETPVNAGQLKVYVSTDYDTPAGYKLGQFYRFDMNPSSSTFGVRYAPYVVYPAYAQAGGIDVALTSSNYAQLGYTGIENGAYIFTGSVTLSRNSPIYGLSGYGGTIPAGALSLHNIRVVMNTEGSLAFAPETFGFLNSYVQYTPTNSVELYAPQINGNIKSGELLDCRMAISDAQGMVADVKATISGNGQDFEFNSYDTTGKYTLYFNKSAPVIGDISQANASGLVYLRINNFGGCETNVSANSTCNSTLNSLGYGFAKIPVPITCKFTVYDKYGAVYVSEEAHSVFTNTLQPSNSAFNLNIDGFIKQAFAWAFQDIQHVIFSGVALILAIPISMILMVFGVVLFKGAINWKNENNGNNNG